MDNAMSLKCYDHTLHNTFRVTSNVMPTSLSTMQIFIEINKLYKGDKSETVI